MFCLKNTVKFESTGGWQAATALLRDALPSSVAVFLHDSKEIHIIYCSSSTSSLILITEVPQLLDPPLLLL